MLLVRRQRRASSASCAGLQSRQLHADTGPTGGNQALVVDQPAGKTRQNWCQGRAPWPLRRLPDGRGRGAEGIVPRDSAADCGTTTTATTSACVRRRWSCVQEQPMEECVQMPAKMARSAPRPPSGLTEVTVAVRIALLPCREPGKPRVFMAARESSGESRISQLERQVAPRSVEPLLRTFVSRKSSSGAEDATRRRMETKERHNDYKTAHPHRLRHNGFELWHRTRRSLQHRR